MHPEQRGPLSLGCLGAANKILRKGCRNRGEKCDSKRGLEEAGASNEQGNCIWMVKTRSVGGHRLTPEERSV